MHTRILLTLLALVFQMAGADTSDTSANDQRAVNQEKLDFLRGFFTVADQEGGKPSDCMTDGIFCVREIGVTRYKWGYLKSHKPFSADWVGEGDPDQVLRAYRDHCNTIYVGETSVSALLKLRISDIEDTTNSISLTMHGLPTFKFQASKWYLIEPTKLLHVKFIEYDGHIVIDGMFIVDRTTIASKGSALGDVRQIEKLLLVPEKPIDGRSSNPPHPTVRPTGHEDGKDAEHP